MNENNTPPFGDTNQPESPQVPPQNVTPEPEATAPVWAASQSEPAVAAAPQKQKKSGGLIALVIIFAVLAIGGVGFGVFGMIQAGKKPETADNKPANEKKTDEEPKQATVEFSKKIVGKWGCIAPTYKLDKDDFDELMEDEHKVVMTIGKDGSFKLENTVDKSSATGKVIGGIDEINNGKTEAYDFAVTAKSKTAQGVQAFAFVEDALEDTEFESEQKVVAFSLSSTSHIYCVEED